MAKRRMSGRTILGSIAALAALAALAYYLGEAAPERPAGIPVAVPATSFALEPEADSVYSLPTAGALPRVETGSVVVRGEIDTIWEGIEVESKGAAELRVTPLGVIVLSGNVSIGGVPVPIGAAPTSAPSSVSAPLSSPGVTPARGPAPWGTVVNAADLLPVPGARVRAVFSYSDDGYPPIDEEGSEATVTTGPNGTYHLPAFRAGDLRVRLHLEVDAPGFETALRVVQEGRQSDGRWPYSTIRMRRAITSPVRILAPDGSPAAGLAVSSATIRDSFLGEDVWEDGQSTRRDRLRIRYTDADGRLRLGLNEFFDIHHPSWYLVTGENQRTPFECGPSDFAPPEGELREFFTAAARMDRVRLQDHDSRPLADVGVEIVLDGQPLVRVRTDEAGFFEVAAKPRCPAAPPVSELNPRRGTLRTLESDLWRVELPLAIPTAQQRRIIDARRSASIVLRARVVDDRESRPGPADGIALDRDLTVVLAQEDGLAVFAGTLPRPGDLLECFLPGYSPVPIIMPSFVDGSKEVDLGQVEFRATAPVPVHLSASAAILERAVFLLVDTRYPSRPLRVPFAGRSTIEVPGVRVGRSYRWAVEGSQIAPLDGEFDARPETFDGLHLQAMASDERRYRVRGSLAGIESLTEDERAAYRVVERYFLVGEDEPLTFASYPLAPDGSFGSVRLLPPVEEAEVVVVGARGRIATARAAIDFDAVPALHDFGELPIRVPRRAQVRFELVGFGMIGTVPDDLVVWSDTDAYHEVARVFLDDGGLAVTIENLFAGRYVLRWGDTGRRRTQLGQSFTFDVRPLDEALEFVAPRVLGREEVIRIELADLEGVPIDGATLSLADETALEPEVGVYELLIDTHEENRIAIVADEFLPVDLVLPPRQIPAEPIRLRRAVPAVAEVRGPDAARFEGNLRVTWIEEVVGARSPRAAAPRIEPHPVEFVVQRGGLESNRFPEGELGLVIEHIASPLRTEFDATLRPRRRNELGRIDLAETRTLRGVVLLPDGSAAAEAEVRLVDPDQAQVFPQRPFDPRNVAFSAQTDRTGQFEIDGLPIDFADRWALVAHLDGWNDAIVDPLPRRIADFELFLQYETRLFVRCGYRDGRNRPEFEFRLRYSADGENYLDLGPIAPNRAARRSGAPELLEYSGVTPGIYRLEWNLLATGETLDAVEVQASAFVLEELSLVVEESFIAGTAILNGETLRDGWITVATDPADPSTRRRGRVQRGRFELPVPSGTEEIFVALVPAAAGGLDLRQEWGEAVPYRRYDIGLAPRNLEVEYEAYDLEIRFDRDLVDREDDLRIEFPHYEWVDGRWESEPREEPVRGERFRLRVMSPGNFPFRVIGRNWTRSRVVVIEDEDAMHLFDK